MGSDIYESSYNVLSLMNSMQDTQDDEFALVVKESEGKSELESDFDGLLVQCLRQRYLRYR